MARGACGRVGTEQETRGTAHSISVAKPLRLRAEPESAKTDCGSDAPPRRARVPSTVIAQQPGVVVRARKESNANSVRNAILP